MVLEILEPWAKEFTRIQRQSTLPLALAEAKERYAALFGPALEEGKYLPYVDLCLASQEEIKAARTAFLTQSSNQSASVTPTWYGAKMMMELGPVKLQFQISRGEEQEIKEAINSLEEVMQSFQDGFVSMYHTLRKTFRLELIPDKTLGSVYLGRGHVVIPCGAQVSGYDVRMIDRCHGDHRHVDLVQTASYNSIEEAVSFWDDNQLATLAIAHGTENYPLLETVLPILEKKYEDALWP